MKFVNVCQNVDTLLWFVFWLFTDVCICKQDVNKMIRDRKLPRVFNVLFTFNMDITPAQFCELIKNLPDHSFRHKMYLPFDDSDIGRLANSTREAYRAKALWLRFYLLGDMDALKEASLTRAKFFKVEAEFTLIHKKLIEEIFAHSALFNPPDENLSQLISYYENPLMWLFHVEFWFLKQRLNNSLSGKIPMSKRNYESQVIKKCDEILLKSVFFEEREQILTNPMELIVYASNYLNYYAQSDFSLHWDKYLQDTKRFFTAVRKSPLKLGYFDEKGNFTTLGSGRKKSNRSGSKGFG